MAGIAAGASLISNIIGAILGGNAAKKAAQAQQQASQANIGFENQIYGTAQNNLQPFVGYGQNSGNALMGLLGIGGNPAASQQAFQNYLGSTNYQFLRDQGLQGAAYANAPNLGSGATLKGLNNYAQGMAGNALAGYENLLTGQEGLGLQAGGTLGQIGLGTAGLEANARNLAAGATGSAALYGANQWQNALNGISNVLGSSSFQMPNFFGGGGGGITNTAGGGINASTLIGG